MVMMILGDLLINHDRMIMAIDKTTEPFSVGQQIVWHQGEEQGATVTFGTIKEVKGEIFEGTLLCEFPGNREHEFKKKNGVSVAGDGYIRFTVL